MAPAPDLQPRPAAPRPLYWLTLALVFVMPGQLSYAVDPKHGPFIAYADVLAALVAGVFVLWVLLARRWREVRWPPLALWAWVAVAALSGLGAVDLKSALLEIVQMLLYFGAVWMLFANVLTGDGERRTAVRTLLLATSLAVIYGLYQYATQAEPMAVKSLFQSRTAYSGFLMLVLPLFFGLTLWSELKWERWWTGIVVAAGALTILAPPIIWIVAVALVVMGLTWDRGQRAAYVLAGVAVFMLATLTLAPLNRDVLRETLNPYEEGPVYKLVPSEDETEEAGPIIKKRWIEWMPSLNMLADNFVLGVGTGNYQTNIGQAAYYGFLPNVKKSEPDTNSLYLVTAGSMGFAGLVALLAYLGVFWRLVKNLSAHAQTPWNRALSCGLYGACLALLMGGLFTSAFVRGTALVWALAFALAMSLTHEQSFLNGSRPRR